jgi:hypothetical protein
MTFSFNNLGNNGHLGNQMFQYAAIKSLAIKHNRNYLIAPQEIFGKHYYTALRSSIDDCFDIKCERGLTSFPIHHERHFHFDKETYENPPKNDIDLLGFFQSDKWFVDIDDQIKKDFKFKSEYFDMSSELRDSFGKEIIGIHIRRTDFVTNSNHISQSINFYKKSLDLLPSNIEVLIFSDDPQWCKQQKEFFDDRFLVSETSNPYIDLCLMTMCDYIVMASSTYSWWGAYLSKAKKIISPSVWTPDSNPINTKDIYCDNWIKI